MPTLLKGKAFQKARARKKKAGKAQSALGSRFAGAKRKRQARSF